MSQCTYTYMHTKWQPCTHKLVHTCHTDIDWLYDPESESADTKEWKWSRMAEGFMLSVLTQHADSRTHIHGQPPCQLRAQQRAGGVLAKLMLLPHSSLVAQCRLRTQTHRHTDTQTHTHTHTQTMRCLSLYTLSLSVSLSRSHGLCICVRLWKHVLYKLYSVCVYCMFQGGL